MQALLTCFSKGSRQKKQRIFYGQADRKGGGMTMMTMMTMVILMMTMMTMMKMWRNCAETSFLLQQLHIGRPR